MSDPIKVGDILPETVIGPFDAPSLARYAEVSGDAQSIASRRRAWRRRSGLPRRRYMA